jgi:hypothetical protein
MLSLLFYQEWLKRRGAPLICIPLHTYHSVHSNTSPEMHRAKNTAQIFRSSDVLQACIQGGSFVGTA